MSVFRKLSTAGPSELNSDADQNAELQLDLSPQRRGPRSSIASNFVIAPFPNFRRGLEAEPALRSSMYATFPPVVRLPKYVKPLPASMGLEEIAYLEKKGALRIPHRALRDELLRCYVEFVHPFMPLLDLREFLAAIDAEDGGLGEVSLIVFQAVMFTGSTFVDVGLLQEAGYLTRKEARRELFTRARVGGHISIV